MNRRPQGGQVLVQVLVMSVMMVILATVLMKIVLQQATLANHEVKSSVANETTTSVEGVVRSAWIVANGGSYCSSYQWDANNSVQCGGTVGTCGCACTVMINGVQYPGSVSTIPVTNGTATVGCSLLYYSTY